MNSPTTAPTSDTSSSPEPIAEVATTPERVSWIPICSARRVIPERGVAALFERVPVAIFRLPGPVNTPDAWYAVSHVDPLSLAPVMARGLVGSVQEGATDIPVIASPLYKQRYDLRTGRCLDHPTAKLDTWAVRDNQGTVELGHPQENTPR